MPSPLTIYQGRSADRSPYALSGAAAFGEALARHLAVAPEVIGRGGHIPTQRWDRDLETAHDDLAALAADLDARLRAGTTPVTVLTRCAAAVATLPRVLRHRPDTCVVWLDAHADLNTPETSPSGYLGGMVLAAAAGLWTTGFGAGLPLAQLVLVGVRDTDPAEQALIETSGLRSVPARGDVGAALTDAVAGRPVYVHVDVDVLEPGLLPTDFAVQGGLSWSDLRAACEALAVTEVLGVEIAEIESRGSGDDHVGLARLVDAMTPLLAVLGRRR